LALLCLLSGDVFAIASVVVWTIFEREYQIPEIEPGGSHMPSKSANVKNQKQYEALKDKGMSKERAAKIANSPNASHNGGKRSGSGGNSKQGGTTAQHKAAGRKGGNAAAKSR
jgi:hypothetical protein